MEIEIQNIFSDSEGEDYQNEVIPELNEDEGPIQHMRIGDESNSDATKRIISNLSNGCILLNQGDSSNEREDTYPIELTEEAIFVLTQKSYVWLIPIMMLGANILHHYSKILHGLEDQQNMKVLMSFLNVCVKFITYN